MVKTGDSWPQPGHSTGNLPKLNCTNELLNFRLQCIDSHTCMSSARKELQVSANPRIPALNTKEDNGVLFSFASHLRTMRPGINPYLEEPCYGSSLGLTQVTLPAPNTELKKGFVIFDQSGDQTRVMYRPGYPQVQIPISVSAKNCSYGLNGDEKEDARNTDTKNYLFQKDPLENGISGEESEMHEDTEEINALLYSDDDSHYSSDDEVTSTGHSPPLIKELYDKQTLEMDEEVASSDGPRKRQRLLDGGYKKLSDTTLPVKVDEFKNCETGKKSSCTICQSQGDQVDSGVLNLASKNDNIGETLRLLETIVPGAEGKDPMAVIDEAIDYLKSLKYKAKALGMAATLPECDVGPGCKEQRKGCNQTFLCQNDY